ncbi:MAG: PorV/PorQ family protein [Elusimicrobia bacterium]|nr:PorV/PorQ family protein [Elusimicrobiota bacterium]
MNRRRWIGMIVLLWTGIGLAWAKSNGNTTGNFLKMGVGGRGVAMGESHTASVNDATALYWNPSGLGLLTQSEIAFMHSNALEGVTQDVLYYARPTETKGVWGVGGSFLKVDGVKGFTNNNVETGDVEASDTLITLGWAKSWENMWWLPGLNTGANVKALKKTLDTDTAMGYLLDLGVLYEVQGDRLTGARAGLVIQNVGTGLDFNGEKTSFPTMMKLGASAPLFGDNMTVSGDIVLPTDGSAYVNAGAEYRVWEMMAFRMGYKGNNDLDSGITYGFGLGNERIHLDYGFIPFGPFGDSHRVSVSFRFGANYRQVQVTSQVDVAYKRALARYAQGYMVEAYMQANQILAVAPWHRPAKLLAKRIETEFKHMESGAMQEQLQSQVDDHFARGEQFFQVDDLLRARREFQAILALQPDHMGAKTYLNRIDERFQSLTDKFYDMAVQAFATGDYAQAGELAEKVLKLNPDYTDARDLKGRVDTVLKEVQVFEEEKRLAELKAPLTQSGRELFEQKRYEESLAKFDEILAMDTADAQALRMRDQAKEMVAKEAYNAGLRAARGGDMAGALALTKKALRYKPDFAEAKELLKSLEVTKGADDEEKSKEYYKESLDKFLAGDPQKAYELAVKALELNPNNVEAQRMRDRLANR